MRHAHALIAAAIRPIFAKRPSAAQLNAKNEMTPESTRPAPSSSSADARKRRHSTAVGVRAAIARTCARAAIRDADRIEHEVDVRKRRGAIERVRSR